MPPRLLQLIAAQRQHAMLWQENASESGWQPRVDRESASFREGVNKLIAWEKQVNNSREGAVSAYGGDGISVSLERDLWSKPYDLIVATAPVSPVLFTSPHSGRQYPQEFLDSSRLPVCDLRRPEDAFIDELFRDAPALGASLLAAHFPRTYCDANREALELDPAMFSEPLPMEANTRSLRVAAGLGVIARQVAPGSAIYNRQLAWAEAEQRLAACYYPYHRVIESIMDLHLRDFGVALLIDCHSMPSVGAAQDLDQGALRKDFILGDRYGTSCAPEITETAAQFLTGLGYSVGRNNPYAGGFTTAHYGRPCLGLHALQIEVNRKVYMDEQQFRKIPSFDRLRGDMAALVAELARLPGNSQIAAS